MEKVIEAMRASAGTLIAIQRIASSDIRKRSLSAYARLLEANLLVTGAIGSVLLRTNGRVSLARRESTAHERSALIASFVIGLDLTECAITEGRYLQAAALLRQEKETLAALGELENGTRKDGKTPNVRNHDPAFKALYEDLSAATHVAKRHVVAAATEYSGPLGEMPGDTIVRRYVPGFEPELARRMYATHTLMMIDLAGILHSDFEDAYGKGLADEEVQALNKAIDLMVEEKCCDPVPS